MPSRVHPVHAAQNPVICSDVSFVRRPDFADTGSNPRLLRPSRTKLTYLNLRRSGQAMHRDPSERSVIQQQTKRINPQLIRVHCPEKVQTFLRFSKRKRDHVTVILERTPPATTISHSCGTLGLLSGTAAISFRKASLRHALGGQDLCRIHAHHGCRRSVACNRKASIQQHRRRDSNLLSDRNRMADCQAQRRGNEPF